MFEARIPGCGRGGDARIKASSIPAITEFRDDPLQPIIPFHSASPPAPRSQGGAYHRTASLEDGGQAWAPCTQYWTFRVYCRGHLTNMGHCLMNAVGRYRCDRFNTGLYMCNTGLFRCNTGQYGYDTGQYMCDTGQYRHGTGQYRCDTGQYNPSKVIHL